jgi:hypothetical protein
MCRIVNKFKIYHRAFERVTGLALHDSPSYYGEFVAAMHVRNFNNPSNWLHWRGIACGGRMHRIECRLSLARARKSCEE